MLVELLFLSKNKYIPLRKVSKKKKKKEKFPYIGMCTFVYTYMYINQYMF